MLTRKQLQTHVEDARVNAASGRAQAAVEKALAREIGGKTVREWLAADSGLPEDVEKTAPVASPTISQVALAAMHDAVARNNPAVLKHAPGSAAREQAVDLELGRRLTGRNPRLVALYQLYQHPSAKSATSIPQLLRAVNAAEQPALLALLREL